MPELSVVVPAFRERDNIPALLRALDQALEGLDWETIIVVDDAFDGSEDLVRERAQQDRRVRCIHRIGRRGLASACIEGMLASSAPYLAVIDADLQHDETLVPKLLEAAKRDSADIVVASRYMEGGSTGALAAERVRASRAASALSRVICRGLTDPMSGAGCTAAASRSCSIWWPRRAARCASSSCRIACAAASAAKASSGRG